jgi:hypothetical protein
LSGKTARTHWATTTYFMRYFSIPRFRAYLGAIWPFFLY